MNNLKERMKKLFRSICKSFVRLLYPICIEIKKECEGRPLERLKNSIGQVSFGEGCAFIGTEHISIGKNCAFGRGCRIETVCKYQNQSFTPELIIGDYVTMEDWCHVGCVERVEIGDGTMIASRVFITDHFHGAVNADDLKYGPPALRPLSYHTVRIGRNVWIGEGVSILPGVTLGDNVIVGANAVVTHSFEANSVIAGCPARLLKDLSV